jgi:DNA invertase Pin-like site-specific DNA recombinase
VSNEIFCIEFDTLSTISIFHLTLLKSRILNGQKVGYIRISSIEQNMDRQLDGLVLLDKKFLDKVSGKNTNHAQFELMMSYVREGDTIVIHSMDRLARDLDDLRRTVSTLFLLSVSFQFVKENLIFSGDNFPMTNLLLSVMGTFAEFERDILRKTKRRYP